MYMYMYVYINVHIYTRVCVCASAHREERWNRSEVAAIVSRHYPTVLSQITITNSIISSMTT